jgi:hypothetical protein
MEFRTWLVIVVLEQISFDVPATPPEFEIAKVVQHGIPLALLPLELEKLTANGPVESTGRFTSHLALVVEVGQPAAPVPRTPPATSE